jgi:hypothetical protein
MLWHWLRPFEFIFLLLMFLNFIKMKKKPFFPKSPKAMALWSQNYRTKIGARATALSMTPAEVAREIVICDSFIDAINSVEDLKTLLSGAYSARNSIIETLGQELRMDIKRHKTAEGYTNAIGSELGLIGSSTEFDINTFKPVISVDPFGNGIHIRFTKKGVNNINIYHRKKGDEAFKLLTRAIKSPFKYQPVLEIPSKPEHWEFRALGMINDEEIGLPSDIVNFVFSV